MNMSEAATQMERAPYLESHEKPFSGKVILITGASNPDGIGAATARLFAAEGAATVIISGRVESKDKAVEILDELCDLGTNPVWAPGDVSDPKSVSALIEGVKTYEQLDVVVNNAGILADQKTEKMSVEEWDRVIDTNLRPSHLTVQEAVRQDLFPREGAAIIHVSSIVGNYGNEGQSNYAAAKAGMRGLIKTQAKEFGSRNIRVNGVAPGLVITELTRRKFDRPAVRQAVEQLTPLGRAGAPEDIAKVIRFLASPDAAYVTGQLIEVDGGLNGNIGSLEALTKANMKIAMLQQAQRGVK